MKFGIDLGHNCSPDIGASGIQREDNLILQVGKRVIKKLLDKGHTIVETCPHSAVSVLNSLRQRVTVANQAKVDIFVSIHFNAFNRRAHGTEVLVASERGRVIAQPILAEICKLGFVNRGVKFRTDLFVLNQTNMPAVLIECCFCDSATDMKRFDAEAIADARRSLFVI